MRQFLTRATIRLWPTDAGLYRLLSNAPDVATTDSLVNVRLRHFPLTLAVDPKTYLGRMVYYRGMYEEASISLLKRLLEPGMTFVDVGANIGLYTVVAAFLVGKQGNVISVEPQSTIAAQLDQNIHLNNLTNVTICRSALGQSAGKAQIHQVSRSNTGQATLQVLDEEKTFGQPCSVEVTCLSTLLSNSGVNYVDGMKIDVEGGETTVLDGYDWIGMEPPSFIFVECIDQNLKRFSSSAAALIDSLSKRDYKIACRYRGKWRSFESVNEHAQSGLSPDCVAVRRNTAAWKIMEKIVR